MSEKCFVRGPRALALAAAVGGVVFLGRPAGAALTEVDSNSTTQTNYDGNILANDLIENNSTALSGTPTTTGSISTYAGQGSSPNAWTNLTDGAASTKGSDGSNDLSHDTYFDTAAYPSNPTITYNFNTASNPLGYTLTSINSICGWADTPTFSNQDYKVLVSYVAAPTTFVQVASVDYAPFSASPSTANSSQVTLTDPTHTNLLGVAAIQFDIEDNSGAGQVFREIDVTGAPTLAPEPGSMGLLAVGALALLRRKRRHQQ